MIWITGDIHADIDISKINSRTWSEGKNLTKSDYLIILGDFGFLWKDEPDNTEKWWLKWLKERSWTTLFIDGNHENHNRLEKLELVPMFKSYVGKVNDSVFHLKRSHYYLINGVTFFCMGGAKSIDKEHRTEQVSWWPQETISQMEMKLALKTLKSHDFQVDFLLFHSAPLSVLLKSSMPNSDPKYLDPTCKKLDKIYNQTSFKKGFSGHFHIDKDLDDWCFLFNRVQEISTANADLKVGS